MNKVVGVYEKGNRTQVINGSAINYDNIMLYVVTDEIPENMIESFQGSYCREVKLKRSAVTLIGCRSWSDLIGKEIDYGVTYTSKGIQINKVFVQDTVDNKKQNEKGGT